MNRNEDISVPDSGSLYYADLYLSFTIRAILYVGLLLCVVASVGCSRLDEGVENPFSRDRVVSNSDQEARTRNYPPLGGDNEKSDCAPRKSTE